MPSSIEVRATLEDLYGVEGKAELIDGRIVRFLASGRRPSRVAAKIFRSLDDYAEATGQGEAYHDGMGYAVPELSSGRESFEPDASYFVGPFPAHEMRFNEGPPTFAVEVRSENNHGPAAEAAIQAKRLDYFEAGTRVVWDVDPIVELIHVNRRDDPSNPVTFGRGDLAEAEPAVPGWRIDVVAVFGPTRAE